jgi:hypothetical protein
MGSSLGVFLTGEIEIKNQKIPNEGIFQGFNRQIEGKRLKVDRFLKVSFHFVAIIQKTDYKIWTSYVIYSQI